MERDFVKPGGGNFTSFLDKKLRKFEFDQWNHCCMGHVVHIWTLCTLPTCIIIIIWKRTPQESCVQHINLKNSVSNESIKNEEIILVQKQEILKNDTLLQKFWIISFLTLLRHQKFWFTCIVTHWWKRNFMELTFRRMQLKFEYLKVPANLAHYLEAVVTFDNWKFFNTKVYEQGFWS